MTKDKLDFAQPSPAHHPPQVSAEAWAGDEAGVSWRWSLAWEGAPPRPQAASWVCEDTPAEERQALGSSENGRLVTPLELFCQLHLAEETRAPSGCCLLAFFGRCLLRTEAAIGGPRPALAVVPARL